MLSFLCGIYEIAQKGFNKTFCAYFLDIIWCFKKKNVFLWEIFN